MAKKICYFHGCNKLIDQTKVYCEEHKKINKKNKAERNKHYDKSKRQKEDRQYYDFYHSKEWNKVRAVALVRDNHLCQHCIKENKVVYAEVVHHKVELKEDYSKRFDLDNLVSLCNRCHNTIHKRGRGGVKISRGPLKIP